MGQYLVEVYLKTSKDKPLTEAYESEGEAKNAARAMAKDVSDMKPVVVSKGGGIAFAYEQLAGMSVRPVRTPSIS